jgi:muconolactone delta-isomerase
MPQYMVERHLPGITADQLASAAARAKTVTAEMTQQGKPVRYLRSTFLPGEEKCFCLFDAPSPERVREANELAQIPLQRIVEVKHIAAEDVGRD